METVDAHQVADDRIEFSHIKIPITKRWPPEVRIQRTDVPFDNLPVEAQDAHLRFIGVPREIKNSHTTLPWGSMGADEYPNWEDSNKSTYQCTKCGYLTQSKALSPTSYQRYECGNDDCSNCTGKATNDGFRRVNPTVHTPNGDMTLSTVSADDVPNHPTHLGRIKNTSAKRLGGNEYRQHMFDALRGMTVTELVE